MERTLKRQHPLSGQLPHHLSHQEGSSLSMFPPGSSQKLRKKPLALLMVVIWFQMRMPAGQKCRCRLCVGAKKVLSTYKTAELLLLKCTISVPPVEIQSDTVKTPWQPPKGTDALKNDFRGVFPGCEKFLNVQPTTHVSK